MVCSADSGFENQYNDCRLCSHRNCSISLVFVGCTVVQECGKFNGRLIEIQNLGSFLIENVPNKMRRVRMPGDGLCMFHSVGYALGLPGLLVRKALLEF